MTWNSNIKMASGEGDVQLLQPSINWQRFQARKSICIINYTYILTACGQYNIGWFKDLHLCLQDSRSCELHLHFNQSFST